MRTFVRRGLGSVLLGGVALAAAACLAGPASGAAEVQSCAEVLPASTDGILTPDTATVRPGVPALAILTGFARWPTGLVGGGSGETFMSCTPWAPQGAAEVMAPREPALFLVDVPAGAPAGAYPLSVYFIDGPVPPGTPGTRVQLSTTLTVSPGHVPVPGSSAVCALPAEAAPSGRLVLPGTVAPGGTLPLGLVDAVGQVGGFNEYDTLWAVACVDGVATPVVQDLSSGATAEASVPAGSSPGPRAVRLLGVLDGRAVWWDATVIVTASSGGAVTGLPSTGASVPALAGAATGLLVAGLVLVRVRTTRRRTGVAGA
ncbi:hypothetical protein ACWFNE_09595 [Cellulomonas sp. NPDC055163]